jgi:hypothetical protein
MAYTPKYNLDTFVDYLRFVNELPSQGTESHHIVDKRFFQHKAYADVLTAARKEIVGFTERTTVNSTANLKKLRTFDHVRAHMWLALATPISAYALNYAPMCMTYTRLVSDKYKDKREKTPYDFTEQEELALIVTYERYLEGCYFDDNGKRTGRLLRNALAWQPNNEQEVWKGAPIWPTHEKDLPGNWNGICSSYYLKVEVSKFYEELCSKHGRNVSEWHIPLTLNSDSVSLNF